MLASEAIKQLQDSIRDSGDLPVFVYNDEYKCWDDLECIYNGFKVVRIPRNDREISGIYDMTNGIYLTTE